jgi:hypothetical protein
VKKRGRGRPRKELPTDYWSDLSSLRVFAAAGLRGKQKWMQWGRIAFPNGVQLHNACNLLIKKYGCVKWVDGTGKVVAKISNAGTLRNEIMKARRRPVLPLGKKLVAMTIRGTATAPPLHLDTPPAVGSFRTIGSTVVPRSTRLVMGERKLHQK